MQRPKLVVIAGPTGAGKTDIAIECALRFNGEIVGADSVQVYKRLDIGSAKPDATQRQTIRHHMIDVAQPDEDYTVADYRKGALSAIEDILARNKTPFVVGGTGLYIRALTRGLFPAPPADKELRQRLIKEEDEKGAGHLYNTLREIDPVACASIHPRNTIRVIRAIEVYRLTGRTISEQQSEHAFGDAPFELLMIGLQKDRRQLYEDIGARVDRFFEQGLVEEANSLLKAGFSCGLKSMRSLGYKEVCEHLQGAMGLAQTKELIKMNTRRYAKRQMTWFRKEDIKWYVADDKDGIMSSLEGFLA